MKQRIIALGFFDGVHLGHGALLSLARKIADERGLCAAALSFDIHPDELVWGKKIKLINTLQERKTLMQRLYGIDEMLVLHFDRRTMQQPWQDFVTQTLIDEYHAAHVVCGHDFRFGAKGEGTPEKLAAMCEHYGIGCSCVGEVKLDNMTVSSTAIRSFLDAGEVERAVRFLGHPHWITGRVVDGKKLGRTIGIPTANMAVSEDILLPRHGVYAAKTDGHIAVVNIGRRPTVEGQTVTVEPWILDFDGDLYGKELRLELSAFLRPERKFSSLQELKDEILCNADQARAHFANM